MAYGETTGETLYRRADEAWQELVTRPDWHRWLIVGEALMYARTAAMAESHSNQPKGRPYNEAMNRQLAGHKFGTRIDGPSRAALLDCMANRVEIEAWRANLSDAERLKYNHPRTVIVRWKASIKPPAPAAPRPVPPAANPSPTAKAEPEVTPEPALVTRLQARIKELEAEVAGLGAVKIAPSGRLVMDDRAYRLIQGFLHSDRTTDPVERDRRHLASTAFNALPITKIGDEERKAKRLKEQMDAEYRAKAAADRLRREAAARKGQETKRRKAEEAEAKAREGADPVT